MIGKRIKEKRIKIGMTQEELARKLGYNSRSSINKVELGKNDIPISKVIEYAKALGTTPSYLMGWEDDDNQDQLSIMVEQITGEKTRPVDRIMPRLLELNELEVDIIENMLDLFDSKK